ncbi:hypothetical protein [Candidatus Thiodiazotropha sp. LNASS1]|uniref:hypothetical protein n=1 Tax=Candidatus Thiodiazotropha sp. LNASS1 TaxID=3096260 RepID=UPI0034DF12E2
MNEPHNYFEEELAGKIEEACEPLSKQYSFNDISLALLSVSVKRLIEAGGPIAATGQLIKIINFLPKLTPKDIKPREIN